MLMIIFKIKSFQEFRLFGSLLCLEIFNLKNFNSKIDNSRLSLQENIMKTKIVDIKKDGMTYILNVKDFDTKGNNTFNKGI